jgi:hypothetical protein
LRGDAAGAGALLAGLNELRASEAPQDQTTLGLAEAFTAAARGRPQDALRHARATLAHAAAIGIGHGDVIWAWALAARVAHELGDTATTRELLSLLDSHQPGHVPPVLRAERDLIRSRSAAAAGDPAATAAFAAAISGLRDRSTPYHLAHALLDQAGYLLRSGDDVTAAAAIAEARDIGRRLRCQPLLDRADAVERAKSQLKA